MKDTPIHVTLHVSGRPHEYVGTLKAEYMQRASATFNAALEGGPWIPLDDAEEEGRGTRSATPRMVPRG